MAFSIYTHLSHISRLVRIKSPSKLYASPFMTSPCVLKKHWNPHFKKQRAEKVLKVFLPDFDEERKNQNLSVEEMRVKMKEKGIAPSREWNEKPMFIDSSGDIFDVYVPPPGDGKISPISSSGVKNVYDRLDKKSRSYLALRKIRNIDYEFDVPTVAEIAKNVYIEAQKALSEKNEDKLHELATEKAFMEMMEHVKNKTIIWNFIQCLEPPRIVHMRVQEMMSDKNIFGQVTVRLHTQQTLAVYDRFGRLMHGSESVVKDVLEYLVFEKHLTYAYGTWKIHGKIIPDWLPPRDPIRKTFHHPDIDKEFPEPPKEVSKEKTEQELATT